MTFRTAMIVIAVFTVSASAPVCLSASDSDSTTFGERFYAATHAGAIPTSVRGNSQGLSIAGMPDRLEGDQTGAGVSSPKYRTASHTVSSASSGFVTQVVHPSTSAISDPPRIECPIENSRCWVGQFMPDGLLYRSYIAGEKEPRMGVSWLYDQRDDWRWEVTLGGRRGLWRRGTRSGTNPEGWQVDLEGAVQPQLNPNESQDLDSADYRFGMPLTYRCGRLAFKTGYYHISSHVGDEFVERNPGYQRINYVRESLIFGSAYRFDDDWQVYGEIGYAFAVSGGAQPWETQFGLEYSPITRGQAGGGPFAAANIHLREEVDWGGSINMLAGWQWMSDANTGTLRTGLQFFNGKSMQYQFFQEDNQMVGFGVWYDY